MDREAKEEPAALLVPSLQERPSMSDRSFQIFMAFTVAVLFVIMSTPLTMNGLGDSASRLLHQVSDAQAPASLAVAAK